MKESLTKQQRMPVNIGHGWVYARPDGNKARCGGPSICSECACDAARLKAEQRTGPFMLVQDDSSHWYVIPVAQLSLWTAWLDSEAAQLGDVPDYAKQVGGSPALVQFSEYKIL